MKLSKGTLAVWFPELNSNQMAMLRVFIAKCEREAVVNVRCRPVIMPCIVAFGLGIGAGIFGLLWMGA